MEPGNAFADSIAAPGGSVRWVAPAMRTAWNSDLPFSGNDGALWAGRGMSVGVSGGLRATVRNASTSFDVSVVPVVTWSANRPFEVFRGIDPTRAGFSSPWHAGEASADLPLRFGNRSFRYVDFGETNARISSRGATVGLGSRSRWWGPGIHNALVLGNNAPSIPQIFLETTHPVRTRAGTVDATLFLGALTESRYFDADPVNDVRPVSGLRLELRPAGAEDLTLGLARLVTRPGGSGGIGRALDAIFTWEPRASDADTLEDGRTAQRSDQIVSLFARWRFPASGFEVYGEWARTEVPASLEELAVAPHNSQGYTLGTQWLAPLHDDRLRLHAEVTYLEQSIAIENRVPAPFYTGRATAHGFTHRGQVLGAAIGPGGSSQRLGADYVAEDWDAGLFVGRTRWENDVMYRQNFPNYYKHDVTIYSGVRGLASTPHLDVAGELTVGRRMNYLFQTSFGNAGGYRSVDVQNITLSLSIVPRLERGTSPRP